MYEVRTANCDVSQLLSQLPESGGKTAALPPVGPRHMLTLINVFNSSSFSQNINLEAKYHPLSLE